MATNVKALRRPSARRRAPNDPQKRNIQFDYSDIHLENDFLDYELEQRESIIHREQYRNNVDSEDNFKKAKEDADQMLQLKNTVNNRKPHTSFERVSKSAGARPKIQSKLNQQETTQDGIDHGSDVKSREFVDGKQNEGDNPEKSAEPDPKPVSKPFNTLTMFLLSLQSLKAARRTTRNERQDSGVDKDTNKSKTTDDIPVLPPPKHYPRAKSAIHAGVAEKYGINVKKDLSRSRRTLGDISKLEHDAKFGHKDKFEERRKKLLAACKDTNRLNSKINNFLEEIDTFKKTTAPDNSLERVLMRSKSAFCRRSPPDW